MEDCSLSQDFDEFSEATKFDPIKIEQNEFKYELKFSDEEEKITFEIFAKDQFPFINFKTTKSLKDFHNLSDGLKSAFDLYNYIKTSLDNNNLSIKRAKNKITLILVMNDLLNPQNFEINLFPSETNLELNMNEIYAELLSTKENIKEISKEMEHLISQDKENEFLKSENEKLNKEINDLKKENNKLKKKTEKQDKEINNLKNSFNNMELFIKKIKYSFPSLIIKEDEKDMIISGIEEKMNKKVLKIKKLYRATVDGGDSEIFHKKCDNIPNTLVLIKSEGLRRFGGFTPIPWKSEIDEIYIKDPEMKTFVFSLDNKQIYPLISYNVNAVYHYMNSGPSFGGGRDIAIDNNPINECNLYTNQSTFNYLGNNCCLSENNSRKKIKALDYEVFQVIFY